MNLIEYGSQAAPQPRSQKVTVVAIALVALASVGIAVGVMTQGDGPRPVGVQAQGGNAASHRQLPPEKQRLLDEQQQRRANARAGDKRSATPPPPGPGPGSTSPIPTGIIENPAPPFSSSVASITNSWQQIADGRLVQFYAGAAGDDPQQGVMILNELVLPGSDATPEPTQWFPTPAKVGALRITGVSGSKLSLISAANVPLTFDTATRRYL